MERLRHLARAGGGDPVAVVREAASALRGLGDDPAGLVVACRRLVEKHPTCGPLWWLCAHVVTAAEPALGAAVLVSDLVVIEALAAADGQLLATAGSRAAASVAYCSGVPVQAVVGRGRRLPVAGFESLVARLSEVDAPWEVPVDVVPLALCSEVVDPHGATPAAEASLAAECPSAPELLRHAPN